MPEINSSPRRLRLFGAIVFLFALGIMAAAQSRGSISGRITDQGGAAITGATVTLRQRQVGFTRSVKTDASGEYRFGELRPGQYTVSAISDKFSIVTREVTLSSTDITLDLKLRPGTLSESVDIAATEIAGTVEEQQRIAGTIYVLDRQTIELSRPFTFNEALRKIPGVYVRDEEGFGLRPSIGLRGLDPNRSAKVLLLEDGVPLGHAPYGDTDAYYHPPIERYVGIEVLKGASQIVYGPQTVGGVINYITANPPETEGMHGSLLLTGGNLSYFNGHAQLGGRFGRAGWIFDFMRKQGEGARENIRSGLYDVNFKSVVNLAANQSLTFKSNYYGEDSNVTYSGLRLDEFLANPRANPFRNDFFEGDRWGGAMTYNNAVNSRVLFTTTLYGQSFNRDWWRQSSNSDQRPNRSCGGMQNLNTTCGNEGRLRSYYTAGLEPRMRISFDTGRLRNETDFGFRYHKERQKRIQLNNDTLGPGGRGGTLFEDNIRRNSAVSGYIQHRFIAGRWTITPGVRIESINIERLNRRNGVSGETELTQTVPGLGLAYSPTDKLTFFAGAHRGFGPPRPADIIIDTPPGGIVELDPELSWNYEVGVRSLIKRGVRLNAAFFRLDFENQIVPANLSGGLGSLLTNAGETLHQGGEFEGRLDIGTLIDSPHNFYVRTAYTWIPTAEYRGDRFSSIPGFRFGDATPTRVIGNRLIYSPEHLLNTSIGYSHPKGFDTMLEFVYTGEQFSDDLNTVASTANGQRGLIPGYTVVNWVANYRAERLRTTFFVAVKNLANDTFIVDRRRGIMVGIPRLVQGGLKFRW